MRTANFPLRRLAYLYRCLIKILKVRLFLIHLVRLLYCTPMRPRLIRMRFNFRPTRMKYRFFRRMTEYQRPRYLIFIVERRRRPLRPRLRPPFRLRLRRPNSTPRKEELANRLRASHPHSILYVRNARPCKN